MTGLITRFCSSCFLRLSCITRWFGRVRLTSCRHWFEIGICRWIVFISFAFALGCFVRGLFILGGFACGRLARGGFIEEGLILGRLVCSGLARFARFARLTRLDCSRFTRGRLIYGRFARGRLACRRFIRNRFIHGRLAPHCLALDCLVRGDALLGSLGGLDGVFSISDSATSSWWRFWW